MTEHMGTTCVQGGYRPGDAQPRQIPIYQSTTWKYDTSEHMGLTTWADAPEGKIKKSDVTVAT